MDSSLSTFPLLILEEWRKGKGLILSQIRFKQDYRESMGAGWEGESLFSSVMNVCVCVCMCV